MKKKLILTLCLLTASTAFTDENSSTDLDITTNSLSLILASNQTHDEMMEAKKTFLAAHEENKTKPDNITLEKLLAAKKNLDDAHRKYLNDPFFRACSTKDLNSSRKYSYNAVEKDPELYEVFLQIKKDYGITEDIELRISKPLDMQNNNQNITNSCANDHSNSYAHTKLPLFIVLREDYKSWSKPLTIHVLAHELEHCRQQLEYPASYSLNTQIPWNKILGEQAADAAAADYQYCNECLMTIPRLKYDYYSNPKETDFGYITTENGYFSHEDFMLYIIRATMDNAKCKAHSKNLCPADYANEPLKNFLPQPALDIQTKCINSDYHPTLYLYS
jgi:hypothetical protein